MQRKVLFLVPGLGGEERHQGVFSCLAVYQLKAYLESLGGIASRFSFRIEHVRPYCSVPVILHPLHYEYVLSSIVRDRPDIVCFSMYVWNVAGCVELARKVRLLLPDTLIVAGGPEVADREEFVQDHDEFDVLVEGDGESPFAALLTRVADGETQFHTIPGVSWRTPQGYLHGPANRTTIDPDLIPNVFELNRDDIKGGAYLVYSRGCEGSCTYCLWCKQVPSRKSEEKLLAELEAILSSPATERVWLYDADFIGIYHKNPGLFARLSDLIGRFRHAETLIFMELSSLQDPAVPEMLKALAVGRVHIGVQSMNPQVLHNVGRGWSIPGLERLAHVPDTVKPHLLCELMYPLPGETLQSFLDGLQKLWDMGVCIMHIYPLSALRGTALRRQVKRTPGYVLQPKAPHLVLGTPDCPPQDWAVAAAVAYVATTLSDTIVNPESGGYEMLRAIVTARPGTVSRIASLFRQGMPATAIVELLLSEYPEIGRFKRRYVGPHLTVVTDKDPDQVGAGLSATDGVSADQAQDRSWAPAEAVLRAWLHRVGLRLGSFAFRQNALHLEVLGKDATLEVTLRPESDPGPAFATVNGLKISYVGQLTDCSVMDALAKAAHGILQNRPPA